MEQIFESIKYLINKYKKDIPKSIENLTKGTIKNMMKRIFLLKRSEYNYDGSETTKKFNQLVLTNQFTLLQKNLRNFSSREFGSFLRIIFRQTDATMDSLPVGTGRRSHM